MKPLASAFALILITAGCKKPSSTVASPIVVRSGDQHPQMDRSEVRSRLTGTWVLTATSLESIKAALSKAGTATSGGPRVDRYFMMMMMSGARTGYTGTGLKDCFVGVLDARHFERGTPPYSELYTTPGCPGPQSGLEAQMFEWETRNDAPKCGSIWPEASEVRTWLIQHCETYPDHNEIYVYAVIERDGVLILKGTSPFTEEPQCDFLEWEKLP